MHVVSGWLMEIGNEEEHWRGKVVVEGREEKIEDGEKRVQVDDGMGWIPGMWFDVDYERETWDWTDEQRADDLRPVEKEETSSEENKAADSGTRLHQWYKSCINDHEDCRAICGDSYVPSRLLDVGVAWSSDPVRLVTFDAGRLPDFKPSYATLSHCWGGSQPLRLLTSNVDRLKEGVTREHIPRVFSEAMEVCWHLGIAYLWIDSLCILQDSQEDWERESQAMGTIYSQATINIAATSSPNCEAALFHSSQTPPTAALVNWEAIPNRPYVVVENDIEWRKSFMNQPLLRRAWVMQERLLATRIIHFTQSELIWECRTNTTTESYPIQIPSALRPFHDRRNHFWRSDFTQDDAAWATLVADYSKCELTFSKDKLVALAGLVSALKTAGLARGRYWAGMWEADFPYCLLWTRGAVDRAKWSGAARPETYRAPSWSWASLDYPIWMEWASGNEEVELVEGWEVEEVKGPNFGTSLLLYCPLSIHITGPIVEVEVALKRPWVEAIGRGIERVQGVSYSLVHAWIEDDEEKHQFWDEPCNDVVFDDFDETVLGRRVWCAPIYECAEWVQEGEIDNDKRLLGLLLEKVDTRTFRRIGAFTVGWFDDREALKRLESRSYTIV